MLHSYTEGVEKYKNNNKPIKPLLFHRASNKEPESKCRNVIENYGLTRTTIIAANNFIINKDFIMNTSHVFRISKIVCMLLDFEVLNETQLPDSNLEESNGMFLRLISKKERNT